MREIYISGHSIGGADYTLRILKAARAAIGISVVIGEGECQHQILRKIYRDFELLKSHGLKVPVFGLLLTDDEGNLYNADLSIQTIQSTGDGVGP